MNKQLIVLLLFPIQLVAQSDPNPHFPKLKISVPCNQEFLNNYRGKWLVPPKSVFPNNNYTQGATERINKVHQLVTQIYPQPMGSDGYWQGSYSKSDFASTIKYVTVDDRTQKEYLKQREIEGWRYHAILFAWSCTQNANEIGNGYPDANSMNYVQIDANKIEILNGEYMDDEGWTIDRQPIKRRMPVIGQWKGYDVMGVNGGLYADQNSTWYLLITRKGMLPYIPVTRKQYLDLAIAYATKFYDKVISYNEAIPDKTERDETKNRSLNMKNNALNKLQRELEKITRDGSLNSPAVVGADPLLMNEGPIFLPESDGGISLTIENPEYVRKDLPAYVPQLFVVSWNKINTPKWCADFKKAIEENFPVERLQAMIDK